MLRFKSIFVPAALVGLATAAVSQIAFKAFDQNGNEAYSVTQPPGRFSMLEVHRPSLSRTIGCAVILSVPLGERSQSVPEWG